MKVKFTNLNDRLTSIANQNKTTTQSIIASFSDISQEIKDFRNEIDRKTNTILSKPQTITDKVKTTTNLVSENQNVQVDRSLAQPANDSSKQSKKIAYI